MTERRDPRTALADARLQELAIAIYSPPLSTVRQRSGFPDPDDALDVVVLLLDADAELEMQGALGSFSTERVDATVAALRKLGASSSAEAIVGLDDRRETVSLFDSQRSLDQAYDRLLDWLAPRLASLDRGIRGVGYRWQGSAGLEPQACPACGENGAATVSDCARGTELRWSWSFRCAGCGLAREADALGPLPEPYRSAALDRAGAWGARPDELATPLRVASALARGLGLGLDEALARARSEDGLVAVGTRAEAEQAAAVLRAQGVRCAVVESKRSESRDLRAKLRAASWGEALRLVDELQTLGPCAPPPPGARAAPRLRENREIPAGSGLPTLRAVMQKTMVLIGDGSHARLFRVDDATLPWQLAHKFDREHSREKTSRDDSHEDRGEQAFAQQLVHELETGRQKGDFEQLVIAAPPKFLGQLRAQLPAPLAACVVKTHSHDYTHMAEAELAERVTLS